MDLKALKKSRSSIKAKLTIFKSHLDKLLPSKQLNKIQIHELDLRLNKLKDLYNEFDSAQSEIENLCEIPGDEYEERENFENSYFQTLAAAQDLLDRNAVPGSDGSETGSCGNTALPGLPNIKLPTINLPTFSGRCRDWLEYYNTYCSLIHDNVSIPKIHKFHYLRSSLKDSAASIIQSLDFSVENYDIAWSLICDRYHNDKILVNNHIQALFNIEPIVRETSRAIHNIIDTVNKNLRALKSLNLPTQHWDMLIIHMISSKLDSATFRDWESHHNTLKGFPTLDEFINFLKNRASLLETMEESLHKPRRHSDITPIRSKSFVASPTTNKGRCPVCKNGHAIYQCFKFKAMPIEARIDLVKKLNLCKNCLRQGHNENVCKLGHCKLCSQRHNSMLHIESTPITPKSSDCVVLPTSHTSESQVVHNKQSPNSIQNVTLSSTHTHSQVLLSTALINVVDNDGQLHQIRALLDNGSTSTFITESLVQKLNISTYATAISVQGINNQLSKITQQCDVTISSLTNSGYKADVNCFIVPHITQCIPINKINCGSISIPKHIHLADPTFNIPSEVQMLLGADLFWDVLTSNQIHLGQGKPTLVETKLGWLVSGCIHTSNSHKHKQYTNRTVHCNFSSNIEHKLNRFFEVESIPITQQTSTKGESECENIFTQTTFRQSQGRFVVTIPLKESPECLGDSRAQALLRFQSLENKFKRNPNFKQKYTEFMTEYESLGHMTENTQTQVDTIEHFLPHHGVLREDSLTTKLRTVFDASAVTDSGKSFNDIQHIGPSVQDDLISILIRFRQYKFVVTSDIEKMYRQILVSEDQRSLQQIFWRSDPAQEIKQFKLNTVTYGTASAPYLATRCLVELGKQCKNTEVSKTILHDFFVDDLVTGSDDMTTLIDTCKGVVQELHSAQFHLRKWRSNCPDLLNHIVGENNNDELLNLNTNENAKILGLLWACKRDLLLFLPTTHETQNKFTNKRTILSIIAQIFDPLGLINPCMLQAKIILQSLWANNISWDDRVPSEIESQWNAFMQTLPHINNLEIPRHVICDSFVRIELHTFSDASMKGYSACVYVRSITEGGDVTVRLLLAKGRVSPLKKKLTMPRLELCGALLGAQLAKKAQESLRLNINSQHFWSDSTIVLGWIKTSKKNLKQFVYNRVNEITQYSQPCLWNYVPTDLNPADIGSRGMTAEQLKLSHLWWEGPHFLHQTDIQWPIQPQDIHAKNLPETRISCHLSELEARENDYTHKYSKFGKLQRVTAYLHRFIHNCRYPSNRITGFLTLSEINLATETLCKIVQKQVFQKQYMLLKNKGMLPIKDKLLNLSPFIDNANLLRVGGRLSSSNYDYDTKHPILLHASHHITKMIVEHYHRVFLHAGPQLLLATLRHKYWIINGRNLTRKVTHACIKCCRFSGRTFQPIMGNLPEERLHAEYPFCNTAVDYAGPITIADRKGRGCKLQKAYICIFVCLATRAVHIELVTDLTSQGFLAALDRFVSRRGTPTTIFSDNGTNFVGAYNELSQFLKHNSNDIVSSAGERNINFKFCPAYSPHFNGLAEGSVKSVKHHLKRVLSLANLDYEEMHTVLVQIEAILNSRPLTPLSSDPNDLIPLTPAHFLIGRPLTLISAPQVEDSKICTLSRYKRVHALKAHFWKRYYTEYISELQRRTKWATNKSQPQTGDMVLVKDDRLPPSRWQLGRVTAVFPGADGANRVADIRTASGTLRRAYNRICPLPILEQRPVPRGAAC